MLMQRVENIYNSKQTLNNNEYKYMEIADNNWCKSWKPECFYTLIINKK